MKKVSTIIACAVLAACNSVTDRNCNIEGNISGLEGEGWVYIQDAWNDYEIIDSTRSVDGVFRFELANPRTTFAYLYYNQEVQLHNLIIEPGTIKVQGDAEDAWMLNGIGTPMNDRYDALRQKINTAENTEEATDMIDEIIRKDMKAGKGDEYRLLLIENSLAASGIHPLELMKCFETLENEVKSAPHAEEILEQLHRLARVYPQAEGSTIVPTFIDITYPDINGNPVSLESVIKKADNKYVLLDFWATWCGPCRDEMPSVKSAYNKYHDKGFEIYAVSCDSNHDNWKQYIDEEKLEWVNVIGGNLRQMPESEIYALDGIPTDILIDCSTGIIIGRNLRGEALQETLSRLL